MSYSILTEARVQGSVAERAGTTRPYSVFWTENRNLQGWTTFVNLDIVGAWGGFLFATKSAASNGFIGPSNPFVPVDALTNDTIFFRMKYDKHPKNVNPTNQGKIQWLTTSDPVFNDAKSFTFEVIPDGKWHFYTLDMNLAQQWVGLINQIRFFPCENGARNDEVFLNFFEIGALDFEFSLDNPNAGSPGRSFGSLALNQEITIEKDVNDHLVVNIDGYGDVSITLTPQTAQPSAIARDISLQLSKVAIGGYIRAQARIDSNTNKLIIESGTRAADSSVQVKFGSNSAAPILGFTDTLGFFIGTTTNGTAPDVNFIPLSSYRPKTLELLSLFDNDNQLPAFTLNPQTPIVEGGRRDFALTGRKLSTEIFVEGRGTNFQGQKISTAGSLSGSAKTFVDINHPFTDDGILKNVFFNGISDTSGGTKWKIFRPKLDSTLTLVAEGVIGQTSITQNPNGGLVLSTEPGVFRADVETQQIRVRRGDLLGVFNASFHIGQAGTLKADALYYAIDGDVQGTITPPVPAGAGEAGIPIYATGIDTKKQAAVDVDLGRRLNIDKIRIIGEETDRDLEYNVAVASSASFSADVLGTHVICFVSNPSLGLRTCFERNNAGFNLQALNDDVLYAINGITSFDAGTGGAIVQGATYFYVNGDNEHLGVFEFVGLAPLSFDFIRDPLGLTCFFSNSTPRIDKPIGKAILYFKDRKNQRAWQIESARGEGSKGGNGSLPGFDIIPEATIQAVTLDDNKRIERLDGFFITQKENLQEILLRNPAVLDVIAADGTRNPQIGVDFNESAGELGGVNFREQSTFIDFQWNKFQWEFDTIRTSAFRWFSDFHWSTKISEFQVFAVSESNESLGDNIQVLFSSDGTTFATAELLNATETEAEFKLGNSPQFLRFIFRPTIDLTLKDIKVDFEEDQICFGPEGRTGNSITIADSKLGVTGQATVLKITNSTNQTADLILDLPQDVETTKQLLYFSKLHSIEEVTSPQVGPPGRINFVEDKQLKEEENVAINALAYGLRNLTATAPQTITSNLLTNGGFETGDLAGWSLTVTQSGTKRYQIPRVLDSSSPDNLELDGANVDEGITPEFQVGNFLFGFELDNRLVEQSHGTTSPGPDEVPVHFVLESAPIDISQFAETIDQGSSEVTMAFRYMAYFSPNNNTLPLMNVMGSPTLSGIQLPENSVVNSTYGTNRLVSRVLPQGQSNGSQTGGNNQIVVTSLKNRIKSNTRFVKVQFVVSANSARTSGSGADTIRTEKFLIDEASLSLVLPDTQGIKWYKSWRAGNGDYRDAQFVPITEFTTVTGSTHWWQPWRPDADDGVPISGQTQGFSNAFLANRLLGIQSFRRMSSSDPGVLGAQWSGEKKIEGFRLVFNNNPSTDVDQSCAYPRNWHVEVLRTKAELGVDPDVNNESHFRLVEFYRGTGPWGPVNDIIRAATSNNMRSPAGRILTWLFTAPQTTEGMRVVFTTNCDRFELDYFDTDSNGSLSSSEFTPFNQQTSCPSNLFVGNGFTCDVGIGASFFQPLESAGLTNLSVDSVRETLHTGNIFAAVDLGRHHNIELNTHLFELVAETVDQSQWGTGIVSFSATDTASPNSVVWGGSSSNARWIRFGTASAERYEDPNSVESSSNTNTSQVAVIALPQSRLLEARVYPVLTQALIPTKGPNAFWDLLGRAITDNDNSTFISCRDYPVVALDLGKPYLLSNESTIFRKKHDFVSGNPVGSLTDRFYWNPNDDTNFTYSNKAFPNQADPSKVEFFPYGTAPPNIAVRWVAFKGDGPLQVTGDTGPKNFNLNTLGQKLFNSTWKGRNLEVFTENANWFTTNKAGLNDISTIKTTLGLPFSAVKGIDYGPNDGRDNLGDVYNAFDGRFDEFAGDVWGIEIRDPVTSFPIAANNFPHYIFRVFRDLFRGTFQTKTVKAIKLKGYTENFYPTDFTFQKLKDTVVLETANTSAARQTNIQRLSLNNNWENITDATFTGADTFQEGFGFTHIFTGPVITRGIRIVINDSQYPDDSVETELSDTGTETFSTFVNTSGPQTRVSEVVIYEEVIEGAVLPGQIDIDHARSATLTTTTQVPDRNPNLMIDGRNSTYWQSTGFQDTVTIQLVDSRPISRLEWVKDPALGQASGNLSTNAPQDFTLTARAGDLDVIVLEVEDFIGTTFSGTLSTAPVSSNLFKLNITKVQGENENADSIQISELRLIEETILTTPLITVEEVIDRHPESLNIKSTLITYAENTDAVASISLDGIDANNDPLWSERDFFQFYLKVNDPALLDNKFGSIKIGNSKDVFYRWDIKNLPALQAGWNKIKLQFKNAADRSEIPFEGGPNFNSRFGDSQVDFITEDVEVTTSVDGSFSARVIQAPGIRYFSMEFRGTKAVPNKELELTLDDFRFVRNRFDDACKFSSSLYLNNSEVMLVNLEGLDISIGALEFWFQPDWNMSGQIRGRPVPPGGTIIPAIFRIIQPDGKFLSLFFRPSTGFVTMIYDGDQLLQFESDNRNFEFERFETFHFALVWDTINKRASEQNTTLVMYANGEPIYGTDRTWSAGKEGNGVVMFGGEVGQRLAASPHNSTALTFTAVPTLPAKNTQSVWALMENVKIYNYPKRDFSDRFNQNLERTQLHTPSDFLEISLNGVNFEGVGSSNLPLVQPAVPAGGSVNTFIRTKLPRNLTGDENRDASVIVRWKTPLKGCD